MLASLLTSIKSILSVIPGLIKLGNALISFWKSFQSARLDKEVQDREETRDEIIKRIEEARNDEERKDLLRRLGKL